MQFATFLIIEIFNPEDGLWAKIDTNLNNFKLWNYIVDATNKRERILAGHTYCVVAEAKTAKESTGKVMETAQFVLQQHGVERDQCRLLVFAGPLTDVDFAVLDER
jgi:hypothetical protein